MATKDLHTEAFTEETITKLDIFEKYTEEWLPTVIMTPSYTELWIFDFFAGPGYDLANVPGSPIRILQQVKNQVAWIFQHRKKINICLNEYDKEKFLCLQQRCQEYIKVNSALFRLQQNNLLNIQYENSDFAELFPKVRSKMDVYRSLVFLDQNGIKFLNDECFLPLVNTKGTDFLYFVATSYICRFGDTEEFQSNVKVDVEQMKKHPYKYVHKILLAQMRERIPKDLPTKLYPFTIKKGKNIYGIIFGASHPRAFDKFLKVAWQKNKINGEANFDIDDDEKKDEPDLFGPQLTKLKKFYSMLREQILNEKIRTNKDAYDFSLAQGVIASHANDEIREMKKEKIVTYEGKSPLVNYEKVYSKSKQIITYAIMK